MWKQILLPIVFLVIACELPYVYLYDPSPIIFEPPSFPPPGYSTQWWYFLTGDRDYFFRSRFFLTSLPFWFFTDIFLLQMTALFRTHQTTDILMHITIDSILSILWWITVIWIFSGTTTWVIVPIIITPIVGMIFVAIHHVRHREAKKSETIS